MQIDLCSVNWVTFCESLVTKTIEGKGTVRNHHTNKIKDKAKESNFYSSEEGKQV